MNKQTERLEHRKKKEKQKQKTDIRLLLRELGHLLVLLPHLAELGEVLLRRLQQAVGDVDAGAHLRVGRFGRFGRGTEFLLNPRES